MALLMLLYIEICVMRPKKNKLFVSGYPTVSFFFANLGYFQGIFPVSHLVFLYPPCKKVLQNKKVFIPTDPILKFHVTGNTHYFFRPEVCYNEFVLYFQLKQGNFCFLVPRRASSTLMQTRTISSSPLSPRRQRSPWRRRCPHPPGLVRCT